MENNTFFWEATKRICSSLDIEVGLFELHKLLQQIMPLASIYLQYYEPELNAMLSIAAISNDNYQKQDLLVPLSEDAGNMAANTPTDIDAFLMEDPSKFPITREMSAKHSVKPSSVAILALRVDDDMLGFLVITSEGGNKLTQDHLKMITLLKEPLSMAMSNTLKHRNELKLFKLDFFFEATRRICGDLDIENAMVSFLQFVANFFPADKLFLMQYDKTLRAMRTIVDATPESGKSVDILTPLSVDSIIAFRKKYAKAQAEAYFYDKPNEIAISREIMASLNQKARSVLVLPLGSAPDWVGSVVFTSENQDYNNNHTKLISLLKEPFAVAMSNCLKHRNELKLFNRDFFFEVTKRICGNLEIEKGLQECVTYLSKYMPADHIHLEKYDDSFSSLRLVARATKKKAERLNQLIHLPEEIVKKEEQFYKQGLDGSNAPVIIFNKPEDEFIFGPMIEAMGTSDFSTMILPLVIQDHIAGALVLRADGTNQYTDEHAKLFGMLRDPFFVALSNYLKHQKIIDFKNLVTDDNRYLQGELRRLHGEKIIGADFGLKEVMFKVQQVAQMGSPVLLLGETGTGKDVIANAIHYSSLRSKEPFVSVNCGAIPDTLIDSELFGHEKGAFTGALSQKRGRFERADKGTIFLDEIGELPLQAQVRLLRVLQTKEIERVGGNKTIKLDIRIIAATNRDMKQMVQEKLFREDLWFRLNVFPIVIPPLRERKSDIPALVQHFVNEKSKELKLQTIPELSPTAMDSLLLYDWPGNVRELDNIIERALILNPQGPISFDHMGFETQKDFDDSTVILDEVVSNHIKKILNQTNGKINGADGAAAILGINPNTLRNRMIKLGIEYKKNR